MFHHTYTSCNSQTKNEKFNIIKEIREKAGKALKNKVMADE